VSERFTYYGNKAILTLFLTVSRLKFKINVPRRRSSALRALPLLRV